MNRLTRNNLGSGMEVSSSKPTLFLARAGHSLSQCYHKANATLKAGGCKDSPMPKYQTKAEQEFQDCTANTNGAEIKMVRTHPTSTTVAAKLCAVVGKAQFKKQTSFHH